MRIRTTSLVLLASLALSGGAALRAQDQTPAAPAAPPAATTTTTDKSSASLYPISDPRHWESAIQKFEAADQKSAPKKGAVLFVGSSSIVKWKTLAKDFPGVPTLNRGFGGSMIVDSTYYADRIVIPYQPSRIVFYAGDNDLANGKSPETIASDFAAFVTKVRAALPNVPIVFVSVKPSLRRWNIHDKEEKANQLIQAYCAQQKDITFVDVYHPMLTKDGTPIPKLLGPDKLHMTPEGYALWKQILTPYVKAG